MTRWRRAHVRSPYDQPPLSRARPRFSPAVATAAELASRAAGVDEAPRAA